MASKKKDIAGMRFGKLVAVNPTDCKCVVWVCNCDCGNLTQVSSSNLQSGDIKSCGCFQSSLTSENRPITYKGETKTVAQWAKLQHLSPTRILTRLHTGWSISKTLTTPA
jgi:hypothetical protein